MPDIVVILIVTLASAGVGRGLANKLFEKFAQPELKQILFASKSDDGESIILGPGPDAKPAEAIVKAAEKQAA